MKPVDTGNTLVGHFYLCHGPLWSQCAPHQRASNSFCASVLWTVLHRKQHKILWKGSSACVLFVFLGSGLITTFLPHRHFCSWGGANVTSYTKVACCFLCLPRCLWPWPTFTWDFCFDQSCSEPRAHEKAVVPILNQFSMSILQFDSFKCCPTSSALASPAFIILFVVPFLSGLSASPRASFPSSWLGSYPLVWHCFRFSFQSCRCWHTVFVFRFSFRLCQCWHTFLFFALLFDCVGAGMGCFCRGCCHFLDGVPSSPGTLFPSSCLVGGATPSTSGGHVLLPLSPKAAL